MNGSHYGPNNGRQQRKRPRDNDDDQYRRPPRPFFDTLDKLRRDLVNLADPGSVDPLDDIRYVARKLAGDFEATENQGRILELLRDCILQFSIKTTQYAATIALAAQHNRDFGTQFCRMIATCLHHAFKLRAWRDAKLFLRLLAVLHPCLNKSGTTALTVVQGLAEQVASKNPAGRDAISDHLCMILLMTLPYLSVAMGSKAATDHDVFPDLLTRIESYMRSRNVTSDNAALWAHVTDAKLNKGRECLDLLFQQSKTCASTGYKVSFLPSIVAAVITEPDLQSNQVPDVILFDYSSTQDALDEPQFFFQVFDDQSVCTVPSMEDLASSIFRDITKDVLDLCVANRKDAARFLIDLESYLSPDLFVLRGTPPDKIPSAGPTWKAEDVVVEGIFAQLFTFPRSPCKSIYYHSVLTELCKLVPQAIAPTFGRSIRAVYARLDQLEPEIVYRFWDWFSHHLSNFGFNWKWQEWISDLELPALHPKRVLIRETIKKEAELSYNQRIKTTLPVEYHHIIPDEAPGPLFVYSAPEHPLAESTNALIANLTIASEADQVLDTLETIHKKAVEGGLIPEHELTTILCQSILQLGHQSFSHALTTIEHNLPLLQARCDASAMTRRTTVAAVMQFWSGRPLIASTLLQKFLNYRLISPVAVLEYLLLDMEPASMSTSVVWELAKSTIDKVNARVVQVQSRLQTAAPQEPVKIEPRLHTAVPQEPVKIEPEESEEVSRRLQKTWAEVQQEQKDVFIFVVKTFSEQLNLLQPDKDEENLWLSYWSRGLFREILRRYRTQLMSLKDEVLTLYPDILKLLQY